MSVAGHLDDGGSAISATRRLLRRNAPVILPVATALAVLAIWQAVVILFEIPRVILPAPSEIGTHFVTNFPALLNHARYTGLEALAAFLLATMAGAVIAGLMATFPLVREMLQPNLVAFQLIPKIALAPMFIIWLGIDTPSRLAFAVFLSFFPVVISTTVGLSNTDPVSLRLCRSLAASGVQTFFQVRVPFALPYLFNGMRIASTMAIIGIVVAEFISSQAGLGFYILYSSSRMETVGIFSALLMLCIVGLSLFGAVVLAERIVRRTYLA
jgi:NitT/TauT family transport system permease protein